MPNFSPSRAAALGFLAVAGVTSLANAQKPAEGFSVDRFYTSAPGGGWFVMDALDMRGSLGAAGELTLGNAMKPLVLTNGSQRVSVVSDQAVADFAFAVTYNRVRLYLNLDMPLVTKGDQGTFGGYPYNASSVNPNSLSVDVGATPTPCPMPGLASMHASSAAPRTLSDWAPDSSSWSPTDTASITTRTAPTAACSACWPRETSESLPTQGTSAFMFGPWTIPLPRAARREASCYSASPEALGCQGNSGKADLIIGPEIYGASAFKSLCGTDTTAVEALLSSRVEETADDGLSLRVKLGAGVGLNPHFGAPEGRIVFAIEIFDHNSDRDGDGIPDSQDACPDVPGPKTSDPRTNGCPAK